METNSKPPRTERRAPQLTPDGPLSGGRAYQFVDVNELTRMRRSSHLKRMRNTFGSQPTTGMSEVATYTTAPELSTGDFDLYKQVLIDGSGMAPDSAEAMASVMKAKFDQGGSSDKKRIADAIGALFNALYPDLENPTDELAVD